MTPKNSKLAAFERRNFEIKSSPAIKAGLLSANALRSSEVLSKNFGQFYDGINTAGASWKSKIEMLPKVHADQGGALAVLCIFKF